MRTHLAAVVATFFAFSMPLAAQDHGFEIGFDATFSALSSDLEDADARLLDVPRSVRFGVPLGENAIIESALSWEYVGVSGDASWQLEFRPSLSWLWGEPNEVRPYVSAVGGIIHSSVGVGSTQGRLGGAVGLRIPVYEAALFRLEAGWDHGFETDRFAADDVIRIGVGASLLIGR